MSLTNKSPSETYKDLLYVDNSNSGIDSTKRDLKSGSGTSSSLSVSDRALTVKSNTDNTSAFVVSNSGGTNKLLVDTTNDAVKALNVHVNTQYVRFGINNVDSRAFAAGYHYPIPFEFAAPPEGPNFGNGTDPATSFTTAEGSDTRAAGIVPMLWYIHDDITIDEIKCFEGADAADGDLTRFHLFSYDFTNGSTSCLSNGTLLARSGIDVNNAGSEQAYLSTLTIDSANVASGKVVLAFFESDSINSDYSLSVNIKYHITG
tara:strand:- start:1932 stop:2714 length:783 start_codon:yes stop_codon:yes gene_type:complete